jgi:type IV pilus assembly protein PilB
MRRGREWPRFCLDLQDRQFKIDGRVPVVKGDALAQKNMKLGEILKQAGIINDFQLNSALSYQRHWGGRFGEALIRLGYLTEEKLQGFLARQFELPRIELAGRRIPDDVLQYIPAAKARELNVIPVERRETSGTMQLVVAMTDPTNLTAIDSLQFLTGCRIHPALASSESIVRAIERNYIQPVIAQETLDISIEDMLAPARPAAQSTPAAGKTPALNEPTVPIQAFRKLEERYENLVRILYERGMLQAKDLDELV